MTIHNAFSTCRQKGVGKALEPHRVSETHVILATRHLSRRLNSDIRLTRAAPRLRRNNLQVESANRQSEALPRTEVVRSGNSAAHALVLADRDVLVESAGAFNGRLVSASRLVDIVSAAVTVDGAEMRAG